MESRAMIGLRIISHKIVSFASRAEAGRLLAAELGEYRGEKAVVLGIPRGGIIVAREIAREIGAEVDIVLAHKLRTPGQEELAMGSVTEDGRVFLNEEIVQNLQISDDYIRREKERQMAEIERRTRIFRRVRPRVGLKGRVVIVTDDGVATGATTQAALWAVRVESPQELVLALPVGPEDTVSRLAAEADRTLCLSTPPVFGAVGQFYERFEQIEDEEVLEILKKQSKRGG